MTIRVNGLDMPGGAPSAQQIRSLLLGTVPVSTLESVTAWLGLEAAERNSNDIFDLAQSLADSIELQKDLKGLEQMGTSSSEADS